MGRRVRTRVARLRVTKMYLGPGAGRGLERRERSRREDRGRTEGGESLLEVCSEKPLAGLEP